MNAQITIRKAAHADIPAVVDFYTRLDNPRQKSWIEIMMDGRHPYVDARNFIIAVDTDEKIVASAIYMPWTYTYANTPIKGIRLEEIFCEPEFQNQGIMKRILQTIAEIGENDGSLFEAIYGSNGVYNHLGYTYALPNEEEGYCYFIGHEQIPLESDFVITEANDADIPVLADLYQANYRRNLLTTLIGCKEIYYAKNVYVEGKFFIIKDKRGDIVGFFHTQLKDMRIYMMELHSSVSYFQVRSTLIRFYQERGFDSILFKLGETHPVYTVFGGFYKKKLLSELGFVKVRNIPRFLMGISGVLSDRLQNSAYAHYSGNFVLAVHNKNEAYRFTFEDGKLINVIPAEQEHGEVDIERDRFIQLLFGRISPEEMEREYSMFYFRNHDFRNLFEIFFPKRQSHVVSVN